MVPIDDSGQNTGLKEILMSKPVVVGGVGGGGTRVVAEILKYLGIYMGADLNISNDNLWFTLLFRRSGWYAEAKQRSNKSIHQALAILTASTLRQHPLSMQDIQLVLRAIPEVCWRWGIGPSLRVDQALKAAVNLIHQPKVDWNQYTGWGWKEPNSQLFLSDLVTYYPGLRYIHVIRNGLDMAHSNNQYQLNYWGHLFGVDRHMIAASLPRASLDYWIRSNEQTIKLGHEELGDRFLLLKFEDLCHQSHKEITRLCEFLNIECTHIETLAALPQSPKSIGRYKEIGLEVFRPDQLEAVRRLGYAIE